MRSHFLPGPCVAATCAVAGALSLFPHNSCAQNLIAADNATDPAYASGWSAGQNGGYGFGAWSFNYTEAISPVEQAMDRTSPYNPFGVAWSLYNPEGSVPNEGFPVGSAGLCYNPPTSTDISKAGRAVPSGLQVGQTFSTIIANPSDRRFYRGYTIVLSTGSDNIAYNQTGSEIAVGCFEYFSYGRWYIGDPILSQAQTHVATPIFDTDTTTNGLQVDITMTTSTNYHVAMMPVGNPAMAFSYDGRVTNAVTWVTYQLYNTDSNFYPTTAPCGPDRTDFYIKSMTIAPLDLKIQQVGTNALLSWPGFLTNFTLVSSTNLGPTAAWNPVSPQPSIVNGQNVVTNSISGTAHQFYRLQLQQ